MGAEVAPRVRRNAPKRAKNVSVGLSQGMSLAGRYRLVHRIATGGMGEVWSAVHSVTRRQVAVKRLFLPHDATRHGQARARFTLEAQAACAVEHPNVVQIIDFIDEPDEPPTMVMELLRGETLSTRLARARQLSVEDTASLLLPVVSAVGTAHARGIVHRDLKPSNIFLCKEGDAEETVKVLDFGIAKWFTESPGGPELRTQTGSTLGTPSYMAPEQAVAQGPIDQRADIWSLGVILYECLSGVRPVEGENAAQLMVRLLRTGIMPVEHLVPSLPGDIAELVNGMLRREPDQRPDDLRNVATVLAAHTQKTAPEFDPPRITQVEWTERKGRVFDEPTPSGQDVPRPVEPQSRVRVARKRSFNTTLAFTTSVLGLSVITVGSLALFGKKPDAAPREASTKTAPEAPQSPPAPKQGSPEDSLAAGLGASLVRDTLTPEAAAPRARVTAPAAPVSTEKTAARGPARQGPMAHPPARSTVHETQTSARIHEKPAASAAAKLAPGAPCEHSRECESLMCVAYTCQ